MRLAHLSRDAKYAIEDGDAVFAPGFRQLLLRAMAIGKRRDALKDTTLAQYHADLDRRLSRLPSGPAPTHKPARRLFRAMRRDRDDLFCVVTRRDVPYINQRLRAGTAPVSDLPQTDQLLPRRVGCPSRRRGGERDGNGTIAQAYLARGTPCRTRWRADDAIRVILPLGVNKYTSPPWGTRLTGSSHRWRSNEAAFAHPTPTALK